MNKNALSALVLSIYVLMGTSSQAAFQTGFQSQTLLRLSGDGLIQTIPAVTVGEYNIFAPGKAVQKVENAALLYDKRNSLPSTLSMGGNYAFFNGGVLVTVSEDGSLSYKGKVAVQPGSMRGN